MRKALVFITAILITNFLHAQPIDYDNLAKEYRDFASQALASAKPATRKWVEETALKHPAGKFDRDWVNKQLVGSGFGGGDPASSVFAFLIAFQKLLNQEQIAERRSTRKDAELESKIREKKIDAERTNIDQQKREAEERYAAAKTAAGNDDKKIMPDTIKKLQDQLAELKKNHNF